MTRKAAKSKKALFVLITLFALPVVAAKVILSFNLYQGGVTNQGDLLEPTVNYRELAMQNPQPKEWQLIYLLPAVCSTECQSRLYVLNQSHIALGKDQYRVHPIIMVKADSDIQALKPYTFATTSSTTELDDFMKDQQIVVVDPLGNLVMSYQQVIGEKAQFKQGKALVVDVRKLLKLSRIG
ncbi:hypothetical protein [Aliivibrio kagoshimensis]|uniref:hypothetical protein n=1 Tax=Aliivibrio kagoshimensis TaxID=2910230 RepID=UPI003D1123D0